MLLNKFDLYKSQLSFSCNIHPSYIHSPS